MKEQLITQEAPSTLNIYQRVAILEQQIKVLLRNNPQSTNVMCIDDVKGLQEKHTFDCDNVAYVICLEYGITVDQLKSKSRVRNLVEARQMASYIMYIENKNLTKTGISRFLNRDHSTVIYSMKSMEDRFDTDPREKRRHDKIVEKIKEIFN